MPLLIAKDAYPELDTRAYMKQLDRMALEVKGLIGETAEPSRQIAQLNHYLFEENSFKGNEDDYYNPRNSYLNDVLERKLGIPDYPLSCIHRNEQANRIANRRCGFPGTFYR